jgi:hypothetical protein
MEAVSWANVAMDTARRDTRKITLARRRHVMSGSLSLRLFNVPNIGTQDSSVAREERDSVVPGIWLAHLGGSQDIREWAMKITH